MAACNLQGGDPWRARFVGFLVAMQVPQHGQFIMGHLIKHGLGVALFLGNPWKPLYFAIVLQLFSNTCTVVPVS